MEVPVLIVGAGPAGLALSLTLARYGVEHLVIERHQGTAHTPRAHIINQRTVEILRHLGVSDRFHALATPQRLMTNNVWSTSLSGIEVARSETWGTSPDRAGDYAKASPEPMANCPQTVLEPMLLEATRDAGGDVCFGLEFVEFVQDAAGVTSTLRHRDTGEQVMLRSMYLIGADGARSKILGQAGLSADGPDDLGRAANVWFRADLSQYFEHRPGVLTWNVAPGPYPPLRVGTLICHKPYTEFVMVFMYDPATDPIEEMTEGQLIDRIRTLVGEDVDPEILGVAGWQVRAQVAPRYHTDRVFLMGDAVHRHPPTNGLGLNMSVADAYNLGWKLALALDGRGGRALLDSYTAERQPVGAEGVHRAITSLQEAGAIDAALGYEPGQSVEDGHKALSVLFEAGAAGDARREALRQAVELSNYQFNAHGIELGYRYRSEVIASEGQAAAEPKRDRQLFYEASTRPGARVPHARLEVGSRKPISSLDLVDGLEFALLTGIGGQQWESAAAAASERFGVPVRVHIIGGREGITDPYGEWAQRREVDESGCVLVRPDRHVTWRNTSYTPDSEAELMSAVEQALGLSQ